MCTTDCAGCCKCCVYFEARVGKRGNDDLFKDDLIYERRETEVGDSPALEYPLLATQSIIHRRIESLLRIRERLQDAKEFIEREDAKDLFDHESNGDLYLDDV